MGIFTAITRILRAVPYYFPFLIIGYSGITISLPSVEFEPIQVSLHLSLIGLYVWWWFYHFWSGRAPSAFGKSEMAFKKKWLSIKELPRFISLLVILLPSIYLEPKVFSKLRYRMVRMWKLTGTRFTILYWAEVYRIILCFLGGKIVKDPKWSPKLTKRGIPKCLPIEIRTFLWDFRNAIKDAGNLERSKTISRKVTNSGQFGFSVNIMETIKLYSTTLDLFRMELTFKLLSSILCCFRAMCPTGKVRVSYNSIVGPFTGKSTKLDNLQIVYGLASAGIKPLKLKTPRLLRPSSKAGPNGSNAITSMGWDLIAWLNRPHLWYKYVQMCYRQKFYLLLSWFVVSSILLAAPAFIVWILGIPVYLGRLSVLPEARGKMRVVGITDWWTQTLFKPLHDAIYKTLESVPQDGTSNQTRPLLTMMRSLDFNNPETSLESLDLTAATDRLPIDVQVQVLNCLGFEGDLWKDLLDREWLTEGGTIRYSVGQPMGAYSSFAMLALTQHVLMHMALISAKEVVNPCHLPEELFPKEIIARHGSRYSVLGDDTAADNLKVAHHYVELLIQLGVVVNPIKGFSGNIVEFAKQIFVLYPAFVGGVQGKYCANLSPVGAKNVLLAIRYPLFLTSLIRDMVNKDFEPWKFIGLSELYRALKVLFPGDLLRLLKFGKVPASDRIVQKANAERSSWFYAIIMTCFGPYSGLWMLDPNRDSTPMVAWAETIFLESCSKLGIRLEYNQIYVVLKHFIIRTSKRPSWVKNLKGLYDGEKWVNFFYSLLAKPLNNRLYIVHTTRQLLKRTLDLTWSVPLNPTGESGIIKFGTSFERVIVRVWIKNTDRVWWLFDATLCLLMSWSAILSFQWIIVLTDLLRKLWKQVSISLSWLLSDLAGDDFAKRAFQGYDRDDEVRYLKFAFGIISSKDPTPVKVHIRTSTERIREREEKNRANRLYISPLRFFWLYNILFPILYFLGLIAQDKYDEVQVFMVNYREKQSRDRALVESVRTPVKEPQGKARPLRYSEMFGDSCPWSALKFAYFVKLILTFEPIENLASKSFRDYRSESLSSSFMKMLEIFAPHSQRIRLLWIGQRMARSQLKKHLEKSRVMPKPARLVRLLGAPTRKTKRAKTKKYA